MFCFSEKVDSWLLKNALIAPLTPNRSANGLENINMNGAPPHGQDDCESSVDTGKYIRDQKKRKTTSRKQNRSKIKNHALENGNFIIQISDEEVSLKLEKSKKLANNRSQEIKELDVKTEIVKTNGKQQQHKVKRLVKRPKNSKKK